MKALISIFFTFYFVLNSFSQTKFITNENSIVVYKQDIQTILSNNTSFKNFNYNIANTGSYYGNGTIRPTYINKLHDGILTMNASKNYTITKTIDVEYVKTYLKRKDRKELENDEKLNNTISLIKNDFEFAIFLNILYEKGYDVLLNASGNITKFDNDYDFAIYNRNGKEIYFINNSPKLSINIILELSDLLGPENKIAFESYVKNFNKNNIVKHSEVNWSNDGSDNDVYKIYTRFLNSFKHIPEIKTFVKSNNFKFSHSYISHLISGTRDWYDDQSSDEVRTTFIGTYKEIIGTATTLQSNAEIESLIRKYSNEYSCSATLKFYPKNKDFIKKIYVEKFWYEYKKWPVYSVQKSSISELYRCFPDLNDDKLFNAQIEEIRMAEINSSVRRSEENRRYEGIYSSSIESSKEKVDIENIETPAYTEKDWESSSDFVEKSCYRKKINFKGVIYWGYINKTNQDRYFIESQLEGNKNHYYKDKNSAIDALWVLENYGQFIKKGQD